MEETPSTIIVIVKTDNLSPKRAVGEHKSHLYWTIKRALEEEHIHLIPEIHILEEGETWQIVPAAAEGEVEREEVAGNFVTLRLLSLIYAKAEIRHLLGPLAENVSEITDVKLRGNCLRANILFFSCPAPTPFVFELLSETVGRIRG